MLKLSSSLRKSHREELSSHSARKSSFSCPPRTVGHRRRRRLRLARGHLLVRKRRRRRCDVADVGIVEQLLGARRRSSSWFGGARSRREKGQQSASSPRGSCPKRQLRRRHPRRGRRWLVAATRPLRATDSRTRRQRREKGQCSARPERRKGTEKW